MWLIFVHPHPYFDINFSQNPEDSIQKTNSLQMFLKFRLMYSRLIFFDHSHCLNFNFHGYVAFKLFPATNKWKIKLINK